MKKIVLILCVACFMVSCSCSHITKNNNILDISNVQNYIIKFEVYNQNEKFTFVLMPNNELLAQYKDSKSNIEEISILLDDVIIDMMKPYINQVNYEPPSKIEGFSNITDFWYVKLYYTQGDVIYDYGASNCNAANILLEQMIGCCKFENTDKDNLRPFCEQQRIFLENYIDVKY